MSWLSVLGLISDKQYDIDPYSFKPKELTPETSCLWICTTHKYFVLPLESIKKARDDGWPIEWASVAMHNGFIRMCDCPFMPRWFCELYDVSNDLYRIIRL